ncbi:polyprenyl synthetase family protein [Actinomadura sp. ATCC 31491]|uniref:Polyprenyl synthetase family protein n=1 Tax=Actinomadura luzonensis TaxID=2805427 RepID=A0ABT0G6T3_9ACTN|nr:polyprenyl synthetase family protein [Actinomadura luzonensis]MCK2220311.1 polyprenyl synthetase family protein [Actinomadura luzonensis]
MTTVTPPARTRTGGPQIGSPQTSTEMSRVRELVERRLDDLLDQELARLGFLGAEGVGLVRRHLAAFARDGGKRLRPAFVYWGHRAAGGTGEHLEPVLNAACAVELVHVAALLLDDVMDEAAERRGRPAAHVALAAEHRRAGLRGEPGRYGESQASLLALLALAWADAALLGAGPHLADALDVLTRLRVEVTAGQQLDLAATAAGGADTARTRTIALYKSAKYTIERPLHLGHAVAGGDPAARRALSAYALPLGEAFQLRDDVLGVFGDPGRTGKPAGDLRQGKPNHLVAVARERSGPSGAALLDAVAAARDDDRTAAARGDDRTAAARGDDRTAAARDDDRTATARGDGGTAAAGDDGGLVAAARELIVSCGALELAERRIAALAEEADAALGQVPGLPADARRALTELTVLATDRSR